MAVALQCTTCNTTLQLDDGFRGGVCRCSGCGALLQVPRSPDEGVAPRTRPATPGGGTAATPNADFNPPTTTEKPTGDLGGSSSGLRASRTVPNANRSSNSKTDRNTPTSKDAAGLPTLPVIHINRVRNNNSLLWIGITLFVLITLVLIWAVFTFLSKGDTQKHPLIPTTVSHPST